MGMFLLSGATVVQAQEGQESDKVVYKKKTVIDFSDVTIEGELVKPEGSYIVNRKKTKFKNLIKVRANFRPELTKSVDAL
jgi:RNase P/RNase MRP subunit p29